MQALRDDLKHKLIKLSQGNVSMTALEMIRQQKEEIDRLQAGMAVTDAVNASLVAENIRLKAALEGKA
jgi:hypothetical protein